MFHLRELRNKFKFSTRQYNKIVAWLNNVAEGWGMKISRPDDPTSTTPVVFAVDFQKLSNIFRLKNEPFATPTSFNNTVRSGAKNENPGAAQNTEWTASTDPDQETGLKIMLPCCSQTSGTNGKWHWREFTISPHGRILKVGAEAQATGFWANPPTS